MLRYAPSNEILITDYTRLQTYLYFSNRPNQLIRQYFIRQLVQVSLFANILPLQYFPTYGTPLCSEILTYECCKKTFEGWNLRRFVQIQYICLCTSMHTYIYTCWSYSKYCACNIHVPCNYYCTCMSHVTCTLYDYKH